MPSIDIAIPVSSAPTNRLALGVGPVRTGESGIGDTLNPSATASNCIYCFEGSED